MGFIIAKYIISFFDALAIALLSVVLFKCKLCIRRVIIFSFITSVLFTAHFVINYILVNNNLLSSITLLTSVIIIIILLNTILKISLIKVIITFLVISGIELLCAVGQSTLFYVYNIAFSPGQISLPAFILMSLISYIMKSIIIIIIWAFVPIINLPSKLKTKYAIFLILNFVFIVSSFHSIYTLYEKNVFYSKTRNPSSLTLFLVTSVIYLVFILLYTVRILKVEMFEHELQHQKFYNQTLDILMIDLRRFKHDYDNTIAVIDFYVNSGNLAELSQYMKELTVEKNLVKPSNILSVFNIKNFGLAGVLASKIDKAKENEVELQFNISSEINEVKIRIRDLCEITSILIDNAIEAAAESTEKIAKVNILEVEGEIIFTVENSIDKKPDFAKINQKGWSTKGENRGLGLWIANNIIKKYNNVLLNTCVTEHYFKQELIVSENSVCM